MKYKYRAVEVKWYIGSYDGISAEKINQMLTALDKEREPNERIVKVFRNNPEACIFILETGYETNAMV